MYYNLVKDTRLINNATNLGNIYLENAYINIINNPNANITWFKKKNGTNCGNRFNEKFYTYISVFCITEQSKFLFSI